MTRNQSDDIVRDALVAMRSADERDAPSFESVVRRAPRRLARPQSRRGGGGAAAFALAAALLIVATLGVRAVVARRNRLVVPSEVVSLSAWRSPTDGFLRTHVRKFPGDTLRLGASLIDNALTGETR